MSKRELSGQEWIERVFRDRLREAGPSPDQEFLEELHDRRARRAREARFATDPRREFAALDELIDNRVAIAEIL